jgi:hypothetical protein
MCCTQSRLNTTLKDSGSKRYTITSGKSCQCSFGAALNNTGIDVLHSTVAATIRRHMPFQRQFCHIRADVTTDDVETELASCLSCSAADSRTNIKHPMAWL